MTRGRRPATVLLAGQVLDHLDALDRAARHADQAAYAQESLRLRALLTDVLRPPSEASADGT